MIVDTLQRAVTDGERLAEEVARLRVELTQVLI